MATLATKASVMSVLASGATVCLNTACTLVYRKTPIWLQRTQTDTLVTPGIFQTENITELFAERGDRQDNVVKECRLLVLQPSPLPNL